jgi:hypothetical protein
MDDTSPQAEERYYALLRQRSPLDRLKIAVSLTRSVRQLAMASIAQELPNATTAEQRMRLADRLYGPEVAHRLLALDKTLP